MPKTPKKTAKSVSKKSPVKAKAKAKLKTKIKVKASAKASGREVMNTKGSRRGFMWKILEQKQQKIKEQLNSGPPSANPEDRFRPQAGQNGFARFHGPRRRAG